MTYFNSLFDGARCDACGWTGTLVECGEIGGELTCGNWECMGEIEMVHLCRACRDEQEWFGGHCISCHRHEYQNGECECGAEEVVHRDIVQPVADLTRKSA